MGIKGLKQFLKKSAIDAFLRFPLSYFKGKRIAIDISCLMYKYMSVCQGHEIDNTNILFHDIDRSKVFANWVGMFINQCITFVESGVTPVYVFDGKPIQEKGEEVQRRGEVREQKLSEIKQELTKLKISDEGEFTPSELKAILTQTDSHISSMMKQVIDLPMTEKMKLKHIFDDIGIPTIQSKFDAEKTCSMLALAGIVDAVYSADTDTLVYGTPMMIHEIKKDMYEDIYCDVCSVIYHPAVLFCLGMTQEQFVDMCIMCGTDYNSNIPGIGPVKSRNGILKYGNIEEYVAHLNISVEDLSALKYNICRDLFRPCRVEDSYDGVLGLNFDFKKVADSAEKILTPLGILKGVFLNNLVQQLRPKVKVSINVPST